ncbi:cytochrome P450 [Mycena rebaudengoi]|nr:cytochrome P450 [Mycena rebaudengoi]
MPFALYFLTLAGTSALLYLALKRQKRRSQLPPGPPRDPLIGHLRYLPSADSATVFHEWSKKYGDVMYLEVLGRPMIILDTHRAATDLLDKRSLNYSDRPKFTFYELLGFHPSTTFLQYGKQWMKHRQMHRSYLNPENLNNFKPIQTLEARRLLRNLVDGAANQYEHFFSRNHRFSTSVIAQLVAGHRITSDDDPYLHVPKAIYEAMSQSGPPGSSPLDFYPGLQYFPSWFPGTDHVRVAEKWRHTVREFHDYSLRKVKQQRDTGDAMPSFILTQLDEINNDEEEEDLTGAAVTMFSAGEATTWSTLCVFVLAMILHPEYQAKAQKEIDSVIGDLRLPDFEDRGNLPLVECILQEVLRWNPGLPLGVPHRAMEDDIYRGMLIPKGSLVFANIRGMGLDEKIYCDPTTFYPERFLPKPDGNGEPHFDNVAFGFGRRVCTGQYLGENSVWISIASILASCTITNAVDENGQIVVPETRMSDGLVSHPSDLRCVISPRSTRSRVLIQEES